MASQWMTPPLRLDTPMEETPAIWLRLSITFDDAPTGEIIAAELIQWGSGGVEEIGNSGLAAYFPPDERERIEPLLAGFAQSHGGINWEWEELATADWWEGYKKYFHPFRASSRIWVRPSWEEAPLPEEGMVELVIDPGRAFGTGGHETTRLCLEMIDDTLARNPVTAMLDVGAGSGILTVAARLLGVEKVVAIDIDPHAAEVTLENAAANKVEKGITSRCTELRNIERGFPLVVANILYQIILGLAPQLARVTAPGGTLILSGLLVQEAQGAQAIFEGLGFTLVREKTDGDWAALELVKN